MSETPKKPAFDDKVMQANFSALLYLLTEQQALIGKLLQALLDSGALNSRQLENITDLNSEEGGLIPTYTQLYNRFAHYYLRTKQVLDDGEVLNQAVKEAMGELDKKGKEGDDE